MHVHVSPHVWNSFPDQLHEGFLYQIRNFTVGRPGRYYRPVRSSNCIRLVESTDINMIRDDDFFIPRHKFEFIPLGDIFDRVNVYATDSKPVYTTGNTCVVSHI